MRFLFILGLALTPPVSDALAGASAESDVRQAMLGTYVHGVDDELAAQVLDPNAIPVLRQLLAEPDFPRRDNVVAFLAHLDRGEAVSDLVGILHRPPAPVTNPEEDRALLLAPQALGRIARKGSAGALQALLTMTAPGREAEMLASAPSQVRRPEAMRADLLEMAFLGLAYSGSPQARARLADIGSGKIPPARGRQEPRGRRGAQHALVRRDAPRSPERLAGRSSDLDSSGWGRRCRRVVELSRQSE